MRASPPTEETAIDALNALIDTLRFLRSEQGCPWDRRQTAADLCRYLIDEAYELQDALHEGSDRAVVDELGDVLFLVLMSALVLEESGTADLERIARGARDKIVRRHPHVFADREARSPEESIRHWRDIKEEEARREGREHHRLLDGVPRSLPPLRRAVTVQRKVAGVGFDWETADQVHAKFLEECRELGEILPDGDPARIEEELGDMLFSVVNLGRFLGVDPERALRTTVDKFIARFHRVEEALRQRGRDLAEAPFEEMDQLWEEAKRRDAENEAGAPPAPGRSDDGDTPAPPA